MPEQVRHDGFADVILNSAADTFLSAGFSNSGNIYNQKTKK